MNGCTSPPRVLDLNVDRLVTKLWYSQAMKAEAKLKLIAEYFKKY